MTDIKDFTEIVPDRRFKIDGDEFELVRDLPAMILMQFGADIDKFDKTTELTEQMELLDRLFRMVMPKKHADLFVERLSSTENPIGLMQATNVLRWSMEQYGLRPTEPSENSSDGQEEDGGTNSTDSAPEQVSTSEQLPLTDSST